MKSDRSVPDHQKKFDFTAPRPRPFLSNLPAKIDSYEMGVARFFQWRTGLDYYATIDQIVEFVINLQRPKVVDLLSDTATFSLRLAGRKTFRGRVVAFDNNVTLLARARQRAQHLNLGQVIEFREYEEPRWPLPDSSAEVVVSIFDLHRRSPQQFFEEAMRILAPEGYLLVAEILEPAAKRNRLRLLWHKAIIKYVQKNPAEAEGVYHDREEIIRLLFQAGFRQVVIQGLSSPATPRRGVFSLVAATK